MLQIQPIPAFDDNYIWLLADPDSRAACVVDPGDAAPVIGVLEAQGLELVSVLVTHHHFDHVGGLPDLAEKYSPLVYGPENPAIEGIHKRLGSGDQIQVLGVDFQVICVPGHTLDHIAYFHKGDEPLLFCGDTLFAGGCGRLFEGTPGQMHKSLDSLAQLPDETRVYCAHEYTLANLRFASAVEPENEQVAARLKRAQHLRNQGEPTVPSTIAEERATNPFLRCEVAAVQDNLRREARLTGTAPAEVFASVRAWKDVF